MQPGGYALAFLLVSIGWLIFFQALLGRWQRIGWLVFGCGFLVGPLAGFVSHVLQQNLLPLAANGPDPVLRTIRWSDMLLFFVIVGPVEEFAKFLVVIPFALRSRQFDRRSDIVLLGIACAAGFAGGENLLYLWQYGWSRTWLRLLSGNLGHIAYAMFWAYALGATLMEQARMEILPGGLLIASVAHGMYNYCLAFTGPIAFALAMLLAISLAGLVFALVWQERRSQTGRLSRR
ncbi:MAG: PrsW family intramembrane metalloprotease [Leptospiraceae bacterium]|nr:PrsW family intramembrane metalloprotease [Leptospiraceae bacterium]